MADERAAAVDPETVARFSAAILAFVREHPAHYASLGFVDLVNREAAGEAIPADLKLGVLTSVVQALRAEPPAMPRRLARRKRRRRRG